MPTESRSHHAALHSAIRLALHAALHTALVGLALGLALAVLVACQPTVEDESTKTIDVEPVADVPEADDPKEIRRSQGLSGILPGGFPEDLPLYPPASLVDYGETEDGVPWVDFLTPRPEATVRAGLRAQVGSAGWQVESVDGGALRVAKEGRTARITVRDGNPGTIYRVEY